MDTFLPFILHPVVITALVFGATLGTVTYLASAGIRRRTRMATTLTAFVAAFGSVLQFV